MATLGPATAQITIQVGSDAILNNAFTAPSPYANMNNGSRNQLLFHADELIAAGMGPGTISGYGFNVFAESGTTLIGFAGYIGTTTATDLTNQWETGLVPAWAAADFTDVAGWTNHPFDTPFLWDGVSNIVIEMCYTNPNTTQNAQVFQSATAFTSCVSRNSPNPTICNSPTGTHVLWQQRPNTRFQWQSLDVPPVAQISASPAFTCTGTVNFSDESQYTPTSWEWSFGDDSTSTEQNPTHVYTISGTFTVQLIATNQFGTDT
ncbi:MAG TPA: PKD domain-containing protein, partial [Flavobacteriales bacterium]|nr:PKD domain-containing protein [Flavobacteriales bacterium]